MPADSQQGHGPVANPVASFWATETFALQDHQSSADLPPRCDTLIVGAGLAGVGTAYHIVQGGSDPASIVMLEARQVASGATGRNGGHVKPDTYFNVPKFSKLHGPKVAAELAAFEASHVLAVKQLVEAEGLDCDFHLTRAVDVYLDPAHAKETEAAYRELVKEGIVELHDVAFIPKQDAERVSGVKGAQCCFSFTAAHLWPAKLVHGLLEKLVNKGLQLYTTTPVTSVSPSRDSDGMWAVQTSRGTIRAKKIVYATNGYTGSVLPEYANKIVPVRGIACHIDSPKGSNTPHLVNTYGIRFDSRNNDYLIPRADGSIVVGGARQRFWHNRERWFGNNRDDELVDEAVSYFDGYMQQHFRGWEDSGAKVKEIWTGIMGYSSDFVPHIGEVPDKPGQFIIAGFSGHGMPEILLSSKGLASIVRDGTAFEQTGLPRIFKTTKARVEAQGSPLEDSFSELWAKTPSPKL
ncbi:unnamed protein product [Clonostachys rosea f. rosea IK726]|uniref:FAD dependent oxidoreductase domain-containing protein n=2 Tax=Bionectria ochroleuca TaxID=29856 RepID=A0A0B7K9E3_BIOOC|nr:unnamed protein product [Clonostachys rosea f. rosea IK726]